MRLPAGEEESAGEAEVAARPWRAESGVVAEGAVPADRPGRRRASAGGGVIGLGAHAGPGGNGGNGGDAGAVGTAKAGGAGGDGGAGGLASGGGILVSRWHDRDFGLHARQQQCTRSAAGGTGGHGGAGGGGNTNADILERPGWCRRWRRQRWECRRCQELEWRSGNRLREHRRRTAAPVAVTVAARMGGSGPRAETVAARVPVASGAVARLFVATGAVTLFGGYAGVQRGRWAAKAATAEAAEREDRAESEVAAGWSRRAARQRTRSRTMTAVMEGR